MLELHAVKGKIDERTQIARFRAVEVESRCRPVRPWIGERSVTSVRSRDKVQGGEDRREVGDRAIVEVEVLQG
jgi:hypothetical protein